MSLLPGRSYEYVRTQEDGFETKHQIRRLLLYFQESWNTTKAGMGTRL